jgi:hypothetical protein
MKQKMKPLTIALHEAGRRLVGERGDDLTNVQCKAIGNWHNESHSVQWLYANKNGKKNPENSPK